ncbi:MAG TPA: PhzF family phenazine biosynthesis protein [Mycobacteriales bacterium]
MRELAYHVVDVFTDRPFAGNPLAVVLDAEGVPTEALQAIAQEFNLSETAFPLNVTDDSYDLRIFTPGTELPFAGHPSVGTAWLLRSLGLVRSGAVTQRCGAGDLALAVTDERVELTAGTPSAGPPVDGAPFLAAVGLSGSSPARVASAGLPWTFVEVPDEDVVRAAPDSARLRALGDETAGVVVFAWRDGTSHARVFAGGVGVPEDPATGSAAAAFGAWLAAAGYVPADGETPYVVLQGAEMGRPSRIECAVVTRGGAAVECRIAGAAVAIATGLIRAPD